MNDVPSPLLLWFKRPLSLSQSRGRTHGPVIGRVPISTSFFATPRLTPRSNAERLRQGRSRVGAAGRALAALLYGPCTRCLTFYLSMKEYEATSNFERKSRATAPRRFSGRFGAALSPIALSLRAACGSLSWRCRRGRAAPFWPLFGVCCGAAARRSERCLAFVVSPCRAVLVAV